MFGLGKGKIAINDPVQAIKELENIRKNKSKGLSPFTLWSIDQSLKKMKADLPKTQSMYKAVKKELSKRKFEFIELPGVYYQDRVEDFDILPKEGQKLFINEFGNKPTGNQLLETHPEWYGSKEQLQKVRALWHFKQGKAEPIKNYMNSVLGKKPDETGWIITNASNNIPALNEVFQKALQKKGSGISIVKFLKHGLLQGKGGVQCVTNELPAVSLK